MEQIFRSIFWIGVISIASSLFIDYATSIEYFILAFFGGILMVIYSLYEQYLLKISQTPVAPVPQLNISPKSPQPAVVAKKLVPLKEIHAFDLPSSSPLPSKQGFFTRLFSHFHHKPTAKQTSTGLSIASLDNVKELFSADLHLQQQQKIGTFQRPITSQPVNFSRSLQQPKTQASASVPQHPLLQPISSEQLLPFEEGLEHYVPTGAEQLAHDHHNRYAEDREVISQSSDTRYQQVSQQRTPLSSPHHLSLLHYLHYKDRKHEKYLFIVLLCVSLLLIGISLFISFQEYIAFVVSLLFLGLILLSASVAELIHLHKHPLTTLLSQQPIQNSSLEPVLPKTTDKPAQQPVVQPTKPIASQQTAPAAQQPLSSQSTEHLSTLIAYVQQSLEQKYPPEAIRTAAQQSGWPAPLIEQALLIAQPKTAKKKKVMTLLVLVVALIVLLLLLNSSDMFLLPYWVSSLSDASPQFYFIMIGIFLLVIFLFVRKVKKAYQAKQIRYKVAEDKQVSAIKEELLHMPATLVRGTYETDFDKLYRLISEKQKLTITEVSQGFNVSRKEAEEWGKILKEQGLIELHYPTVGDLELLWKK
ncbi:MAG: hypothetical protein Q8L34_02580 [Candidatus Woesearchaeota archaeon]|nr:hypothetical protein [Candidatus Woesearchaeota archaeon]